jgi:Killing trait
MGRRLSDSDGAGVPAQPDSARSEDSAATAPLDVGPAPAKDETSMSDIAKSATIDTPIGEDVLDIASAPARSAAIVYGAMANALGLAMLNDVAAQQQASIGRQTAVTMACGGMMALFFASDDGGSPHAQPPKQQAAGAGAAVASAGAEKPDVRETAPAQPGAAAADETPAGPEPPTPTDPAEPGLAEAIDIMQAATLSPQVVLTSGSGKAYQLVAQSAALAIVDAGDLMRAAGTLAVFVKAMALTKYAITGEEKYAQAAVAGTLMLTEAIADYAAMCTAAAAAVNEFPSG